MTKPDYMECHADWLYDDGDPIRVTPDEEEDEDNEWM